MSARRYLAIGLGVVAGAVLVSLLARAPRSAPKTANAPAAPVVDLALVVRDGAIDPEVSEVPLGTRVRLAVTNRGRAAVTLALTGYDDRVRIPGLDPGATRQIEFLADRPGEAFAWTLDGEPVGRIAVPGAHLLEGHR
jgi:hypothetical protein